MPRQIGIVGTRNAKPHTLRHVEELVTRLYDDDPTIILVSGGGGDVDNTAEATARRIIQEYRQAGVDMNDPIVHLPETFPEGHPRAGQWVDLGAGKRRNTLIVRDSTDRIYAFWNGLSMGTLDTIKKAIKADRRLWIVFENGIIWDKRASHWNPLAYAEEIPMMFDVRRLAQVLWLRLELNKHSKLNLHPDGTIDEEKLAYADGRTNHAYVSLLSGVTPTAGTGPERGVWYVPSENKKRLDVRSHRIGLDGWCDCDAVVKGHKPCFAMFSVWMWQRLISPSGLQFEIVKRMQDKQQEEQPHAVL